MTRIDSEAFYGCDALVSVTFPKNLKEIQSDAFAYCEGLETLVFSDSVTTIGAGAFYGCDALVSVTFPKNLKEIQNNAFAHCEGLKTVVFSDSVSALGTGVFDGCKALENVTLGTGLTKIPDYCFRDCHALPALVLPYRVTAIGKDAFVNDMALTAITIPRATTSIADGAFSYRDRLTIYGMAGTEAEAYATRQGFTFVAIDKPATSVTLNKTSLFLTKGASGQLTVSIEPADFTDVTAWKSSNTDVATVDANGLVKAIGIGNATINFVAGNKKASCKVCVVQPVTSVSLNKTRLELEGGAAFRLSATVNPANAYDKSVLWSSSDESVATVDAEGLVKALKKGSATIKVTAQDGSGRSASCNVTVVSNLYAAATVDELQSPHPHASGSNDNWSYTLPGAASIDVTFSGETSVEEGSDYIYIYSADGALVGKYTGAALAGQTVTVPGDTVLIKLQSDDTYNEYGFAVTSVVPTSEQPPEPVLYTVVVDSGTADKAQAEAGETVTITAATPRENYEFAGWIVVSGGAALADPTSAVTTFVMPAESVKVKATFKAKPPEPPVPPEPPAGDKGDVNGDGEVDNLDAAFILQYDAGLIDEAGLLRFDFADVNLDGEVDNLDAALVLQYDAGIIDEF